MEVIKIELEGLTCSFRYPHFHIGNQLSYRMPPPSTIYGHICSAAGEWVDKSLIKFGYSFTNAGYSKDYEHIYQLELNKSRKYNLSGQLVPLWRDFMFNPKLVLYIDSPFLLEKLFAAFRSPKYPVILGRSQDLACYRKVEIVSLEAAKAGYFENTLLPWSYKLRTKLGTPVLMPKFIDPIDRKIVVWSPYLLLENTLFLSDRPGFEDEKSVKTITYNNDDGQIWVDPSTPELKGGRRIIAWHDFLEEKHDRTSSLK